jgi:gliding motility-associated-like protein
MAGMYTRRFSDGDASTGSSITINQPGPYWVEVTDSNGCTATDTLLVTPKTCQLGVFVPTAFTPDHNGNNARFRALVYGTVSQFEFAVFSRWGQQVFAAQNFQDGWDGMINGTPAPAGTYVWYCRYKLAGEPQQLQKGTVILLR